VCVGGCLKHSRNGAGGRRHRRTPGIGGTVARGLGFLLLLSAGIAGLRWLSGSSATGAVQLERAEAGTRSEVLALGALRPGAIQARNPGLVYPYSVIPGGARSSDELQQAAEHDPVVAAHYSGFNYHEARVVEVKAPRLVYVSYRQKGKIFWSRRQASLHPGETLLTDGKITARTRCGNQVSVLPRNETSPEEPSMAELDRPDAVASGMEQFPPNFNSSLFEIDPLMPLAPGAPSGGLAYGPPPLGFMPMPGGGGVVTPSTPGCTGSSCNPPPPPPPPPPPAVPEPGTALLVLSGAGALIARSRYSRRPFRLPGND